MQEKLISLSRHQRAIWLEALLHPDRPIFNIGTYVLFNGVPNPSLLETAIQRVIDQHDALRMQVVRIGAEPYVIFNASLDFKLSTTHHASQELAKNWMEQDFETPIAIDAEKLFEIQLVQFHNQAYLYLKHHHIYIDGWGRGKLVQAIADQYNAFANNQETESGSSYQQFLEEEKKEPQENTPAFWKSMFNESFNRTALFDPLFDDIHMPSERLVSKWKSASFHQKNGQKDQLFIQLASLATTLAVTQAQQEIVIGIPLLNRFDDTSLNTIGYYVGLIPLRIEIPEDILFDDLVKNIKERFRSTRNHRDISIQEINRHIGIQTTDFPQAYDVVFSFEPHNHNCTFGTISALEAGTFSSDFEQNPIVIHAQQFIEDDQVDFVWDYNTKYLNRQLISAISKRFEQVLDSAHANPHKRLSELSILSTSERIKIQEFTKGGERSLQYNSIFQWIDQNLSSYSEEPILFDNQNEYTSEQIRNKAILLASELQKLEAKSTAHVAIHLPRSAHVIIAMAGCVYAGLPYVYIDPELGQERKKRIIQDAQVNAIIVVNQEDWDISQIPLSSLPTQSNWKAPKTHLNDPLYALFTSGSTGTPKEVSIPHKGIVNLIQELESSFFEDAKADTKLGLVSSFSFDASVQFIFAHLCLGYPLYIVPEQARKDGRELAHFFADQKISHADGVPAYLTSLYLRNASPPSNYAVKRYLIGGEAMIKEQIKAFFKWVAAPVQITNAYGPTECSVDATLFHFTESSLDLFEEIPIGRPITNTEVHLLDPRGIPVPLGSKGEIYVGGMGIASTYLNNAKKTEEAFSEHPDFGRLYKTGDLGTWLKDGNIQFFGRNDHQVKIRGFRIELGEIETCLKRIPEINDACVLVNHQSQTKSLVAVIQSEKALNEPQLRLTLLKYLPEYMVPNTYHFLNALPKTASGKLDRKKIAQLPIQTIEVQSVQPQTPTEKSVAIIVSALLDSEFPDVNKSFFDLGGDSLSLVYLITELEEVFGLELPVHQLADQSTIREIAAFLEHKIEHTAPEINFEEAVDDAMEWSIPNPLPPEAEGSIALLTGSTGFVGAFLLKELLNDFDAVYCLVRSSSELHAQLRLKWVLDLYQLEVNPSDSKIRYVYGDLSKPQLGLSELRWEELSQKVSVIYHSGAEVHFLKNAEAIHNTNVRGTSELLKLASSQFLKPMHFISTVGIFSQTEGTINEAQDIAHQVHTGKRGYESTKWIAEGCALRARKAGIPCSIYRLARVTGHSKTGTPNFDDFFHRFLLGCLDLEIFPEALIDRDTDLTAIDIAIKGITALSHLSSQTFHLINPNRMPYKDLLSAFVKAGHPIQVVTTDQFLKIITEASLTADHPFYTIMPILKQKAWFSVDSKRFGMETTLRHLEHEGVEWPELIDLLEVYANRMIHQTKGLRRKMNIKTQ